ncbi:MAG: hypothetical protein PHN39_02190 [Candidatus Pacebacteria bacterium]|nr:hypothetical protein [Candidatus Paceibacterota bacterium]
MSDSKDKARLKRKQQKGVKNIAKPPGEQGKIVSTQGEAIKLLKKGFFSKMEHLESGSYRLLA